MKLLSVENKNAKALKYEGQTLPPRTALRYLDNAVIYCCLDCAIKLSDLGVMITHQALRPRRRQWLGLRSPLLGPCPDSLGDGLRKAGGAIEACAYCQKPNDKTQCIVLRFACGRRRVVCIECFSSGNCGRCGSNACDCKFLTMHNSSGVDLFVPEEVLALYR